MYSNIRGKSGNTIGENVYHTLRKNIIDLRLTPGEDLSIKDIAETLEVSRSPVRDAIINLSKEGLVDTIPQKGTMVSKIDLKRVEEERFLRASLEEKALILCMNRITENDIVCLEKNILKQEEYMRTKDHLKFLDYDDEFHENFFRIAEKMLCWEMIQSMSGHYRRIRFITLWDDSILNDVINQHLEFIKFLKKNNVEALIKLSNQHCSKLSNEEKDLLRKFPDYFKQKENIQEKDDNFLKKDFMKLMQ